VKRLGFISFMLLLGVLIVVGLSYMDNKHNRAEAEAVSSQIHQEAQATNNIAPPVVATPPVKQPETQINTNPVPRSTFLIDVSVSEQKVRIFENQAMIKEWVVSTGENNATPLGRFTIQNRGEWFFSEKYQQGAMWWVSFKDWGIYLFHSVPMDNNRSIIADEASKLGTPASHGCVRLEVENARWIYENIPQGTEVYIHA